MSCSLYWRPVKEGKYILGDSRLRDAIRDEFGDYPMQVGDDALPFLRGLRAAKVEGADKLIEIIEKNGTVELYMEC